MWYGCKTALVPHDEESIDHLLSAKGWGWYQRSPRPGFCVSWANGEQTTEYIDWGGDYGHRPLVVEREYHGVFADEIELLEEFRLFFNLHFDRRAKKYFAPRDDGRIEEVARVEDEPYHRVMMSRSYLERFMAATQVCGVQLFDATDYGSRARSVAAGEAGIKERTEDYELEVWSGTIPVRVERPYTRMMGKRVIRPAAVETCGVWPFDEEGDEEYPEFIIGVDERGASVLAACGPEHDVDYLTPVFFSRDVLGKYYGNPALYEVRDGYLGCGGLWGVQIDNDSPDAVMVFLGDIGRDIPESERPYWLSHNIVPPVHGASSTVFERSILARFTDAVAEDLVFKQKFTTANELWAAREGWPLFKALRDDDEHAFKALHVPLREEQREFDEQVLALAKVLIDSLNEKALTETSSAAASETRGIKRLNAWLGERGAAGAKPHIDFLHALWDLRHGSGHRKGEQYRRASEYFGLDDRGLIESYRHLLRLAADFMDFLMTGLPDE